MDPMDDAWLYRDHVSERVSINLDKVRILFIINQKSQLEISNQLKIKWDSAFYEVCTVRQPKYRH
jgi:hypothetical protein